MTDPKNVLLIRGFWALLELLKLTTLTTMISVGAFADVLDDSEKTDVRFEAGDISIGATLYRPAGTKNDLPAIVTVHGSAPSTREEVGFYTFHALKMGFAVLSFDKRGTGTSTGKYIPFSVESSDDNFRKLASDVVHSVRWLAKQPGIDEARIGLFGGSQAGWIMPLAASQETLVSFIIAGEGVPISTYAESIHAAISGDDEWIPIKSALADAALIDLEIPESILESGFNPTKILNEISVPTLWVFGMRDSVIPVEASITRLEELIQGGKTNNHVHVYPFGDHNFTNRATGERYDLSLVVRPWLHSIGIL